MSIYRPFTYLIGWSSTRKFYYGARYKRGTCPADLWTVYFTSSATVTEYREMHGEPDIIQIRKIFRTADEARKWEARVLRKVGAKGRTDFLNLTDAPSFPIFCKPHTAETKSKIASALEGRPLSEDTKRKLSEAGKTRIFTDETKARISSSLTGKPLSSVHRLKISLAQTGKKRKPMSEETKNKIRKLRADRKLIQAQPVS